jgi:hypothetical protein
MARERKKRGGRVSWKLAVVGLEGGACTLNLADELRVGAVVRREPRTSVGTPGGLLHVELLKMKVGVEGGLVENDGCVNPLLFVCAKSGPVD